MSKYFFVRRSLGEGVFQLIVLIGRTTLYVKAPTYVDFFSNERNRVEVLVL